MKNTYNGLLAAVAGCFIMLWATYPARAASGLLGTPTVSFGAWLADPDEPVDRFAADPPRGAGNVDEIIPQVVIVKRGSAVNFNIAGLHNVAIYDDGKKPEDVDLSNVLTELPDGSGNDRPAGGIIDDPDRRVFLGQDPSREDVPRDRVEVVKFPKPGLYLVICTVYNHFNRENMWGYLKVL